MTVMLIMTGDGFGCLIIFGIDLFFVSVWLDRTAVGNIRNLCTEWKHTHVRAFKPTHDGWGLIGDDALTVKSTWCVETARQQLQVAATWSLLKAAWTFPELMWCDVRNVPIARWCMFSMMDLRGKTPGRPAFCGPLIRFYVFILHFLISCHQ